MLLSCLGGVAGLLMARCALHLLVGIIPATVPRSSEVGLDVGVLGFTVAVSMLTGLTFALVPLLQLRRSNVSVTLKREGRGGGGGFGNGRVRGLLVVSEMALVTVLLIGACLLTRSFWRLSEVHLGFNPERIVAVDVSLGGRNYTNGQAMVRFVEKFLPRLAELPGAESVATVNGLPLDLARENMDVAVTVEGRPPADPDERLVAGLRQASPGYFTTLGISLAQGRHFTDRDNESAPAVAIVNESFARQFLPGRDPIGKRISSPDFGQQPCEIIGLIKDVKHSGLDAPARPEVFRPHLQSCFSLLTVVVRSRLSPADMVVPMRAAVAAVDRDVAVYNPRTMRDQVTVAGAARKFSMLLMGLLAGLALALGMVGVYGVLSCVVAERTQEIGLRMALGAPRGKVMLTVIGRGMKSVVLGAAIGLAAALPITRSMRGLLFEIGPADPFTFVLVTVLLGGVASLACYLPARRAAHVDPMEALGCE
jgi:putative ABC transport system permease protein